MPNKREREREKKILFEPSEKLPQMLRGTTSLGQGQKLYVRLENTGEEDQVIYPSWKIGTVEVVEEEPDFPAGAAEEEGLPEIPGDLSGTQGQELWELLEEFKDVFVGKDFRLGSTGVLELKSTPVGLPLGSRFTVRIRKFDDRSKSSSKRCWMRE